MPKKITYDYISRSFNIAGYKLISEEYINSATKLLYECPNGHKHSIKWDHWRDGARCPYCAGNNTPTIEEIAKRIALEGYKLLSAVYINNKTPLQVLCPKGHKYEVVMSNWVSGHRCPHCAHNSPNYLDNIGQQLSLEGYALVTTSYINNKTKLECVCPNNHVYKVSWDNWNSCGSRCPTCSLAGSSKPELELIAFIKNFGITVHTGVRDIISPYELDIVIPDKKIAIEYCGLYWHSDACNKDSSYHINKLERCLEAGYRLITIFEDEYITKKPIVLSRLSSLIGIKLTSVYARKCRIQEISVKEARMFCEENHLQGYGAGASIKIGAFYNQTLIAVMTFSKPSLAKGAKDKYKDTWELHRFCSKLNLRVVGIASKLLTYFKRNHIWESVFSFADRRWSTGELYANIGFNYSYSTACNYWYFKNNTKRYHRYGLRKPNGSTMSERTLRKAQGYNRIWDCGNLKYIMHNN
jgi:G:T-mismatch repair DNA endonuclease (very short patch repair protein)